MNRILITGGAGYIGSHTCVELLRAGHEIVVLDNLWNARKESLRRVTELAGKSFPFVEADVRDRAALDALFRAHDVDAVIHFAGLKAVGESVAKPLLYWDNNVCGTVTLLEAMASAGVKTMVFSSSATVYGDPASVPIREDFPVGVPTNPYGRSKLVVEQVLTDLEVVGSRLADRSAPLLQPRRSPRERTARRGPPRHPEQPHAVHLAGRRGPARGPERLRRRLPDPRRHRGAGLPPRRGPGGGAREGRREAGRGPRDPRLEPRHGPGLRRAGGRARLREGLGPRDPLPDRSPAAGRHRAVLGGPVKGRAGARLEGAARPGRDVRGLLALAGEATRTVSTTRTENAARRTP